MSTPNTDYDSPWKEAITLYFQDFMAFCFSAIATEIDWSRGYEFLDKELQQIMRDAEIGRRIADALVKVWQLDGTESWVLLHIELQTQQQTNFAERMYVYHYRLRDRYNRPIVSLGVLGDTNPKWRPKIYKTSLWGCSLRFRFPIVKLLDYEKKWTELDASTNPFATVVMAHLKAQATKNDAPSRKAWKLQLTRRLFAKGYDRQDILELYRFIDWLLELPEPLELEYQDELVNYEQGENMPYITSIERFAERRGIETGRQEEGRSLIKRLLNRRIGNIPEDAIAQIDTLSIEALEDLGEALLDFAAVEDLKTWLTDHVRSVETSANPDQAN